MGDPKTVLEGCVKYRDKKKWKARWAVVSKLSPVADCLHLQLYRDSKERCKNGPTKASLSLEAFLGLETGFTLDKESNTLALICSELVVVLAFDSRELLIQWQVKIKANLAEEQQFLVQITHVPAKSKLPCGPARLHVQDYTFCLVSGVPPRLLATWPIKELRRFGVVEGKFCFEGGSLCGKGEGLHVLLTTQAEEVLQAMDLASKGKLLGKRKALSRKNSLLETSTRATAQKAVQHIPDKCSTNDSCRPLLSSGSDTSSTCDACSEIILASDPMAAQDPTYNSASAKASSCRIHYRWPSCMSRWGQSSTVTASDVESMDTVSVTLSDYQGPAHSSANSKASSHGASLLCLCEAQGTWPFNHCTKCGRQFYCRSSLGPSNGGKQRPVSPEVQDAEANNGFSPQWTMDALLPSPSKERNGMNSKKTSTYQLVLPTSDRASLCSHTSRSSSASTASSSGSEYSVPRNYLDNLYDKPRTLHSVLEGQPMGQRNGVHNGNSATFPQGPSSDRKPNPAARGIVVSEREIICPCHDPINEWVGAKDDQPKLVCSCWNQLSLSVLGDKEICGPIASSQRSVSANPSPSSSPKKVQNVNGSKASANDSSRSSTQGLPCTCRKFANGPYMHYAVPRTTLANIYLKEKQALSVKNAEAARITENPLAAALSEDYDVPKKFSDILNSEIMLKSPLKNLENGPCTCNSLKIPVSGNPVPQPTDSKILHRYESPAPETVQMCTCQRLVLWAGSFVPCLGGAPSNVTDQGWQCSKGIGYPNNNARAVPNHYGTICCEPPRTAEVVLVNGKAKHVMYGPTAKGDGSFCQLPFLTANAGKTRACSSKPEESVANGETSKGKEPSSTYANVEFPQEAAASSEAVAPDGPNVNYANLDFAQTLLLYENSSTVLTRLDQKELKTSAAEKPTLPPRGIVSTKPNMHVPASRPSENKRKADVQKQLQSEQKADIKNSNNSIYELMNFEKPASTSYEDDYLMMQPVYHDKTPAKTELKDAGSVKTDPVLQETPGADSDLPLRPFMPFSYPHFESNEDDVVNSEASKCIQLTGKQPCDMSGEVMTRRHHLINEDMDLRSTRSNSLSELKKMVLLRKRSSSVDGKNNVSTLDHTAKSNPSSPIFSHKPSVQRKHSLFSKLNLRSKEKSMSTNEIIPLGMVPTSPNLVGGYRRSNLHRSADCLKLNEEYANSDDDLANENADVPKETVTMKRSSSVPCRSAMPGNFPSPRKTNVPVIPELNDLNKDSNSDRYIPTTTDEQKETSEPEYRFETSERLTETIDELKPYCDSNCKQNCVSGRYDGFEMPASRRYRCVDNVSVLDPQKSTTSSSSSDISDFIESLSHCSRSSSSSSSSCNSDCIRVDDIYHKCTKLSKKSTHRVNSPPNSKASPCPHIMIEDSQVFDTPCTHQAMKNSHNNDSYVTKNPHKATISSPLHHSNQEPGSYQHHDYNAPNCSVHEVKASDPVNISDSAFAAPGTNAGLSSRMRSCSRSPTSSTSSLSTSPSITDYSSSSSGNCCSSTAMKDDIPKLYVGNGPKMAANSVQLKQSLLCSKMVTERAVGEGSHEGACSSNLGNGEE